MKLIRDTSNHGQTITAYGPGWFEVAGVRIETSLIIMPDRLIRDWARGSGTGPEPFSASQLASLAELNCAILLLGTGPTQRFPERQLLRPILRAGLGIEIMTTPAACRTYNLLASEGRSVAAALLPV
ncbi:MAG TPA: Mth938-like domain-containing protein [Rhodocyclaceae bacterium]|nr:Mth938-like domain-containing protein [Rhodocyclaceae bacterium]